ncbi:hypothetical protein ACTQ49_13230 [Luteococcus sp. Sow4_B9]|uniref:hypothetical protein n=1 Tax=Luteococcus sp. Sow4_B9 TaxID=3438792 RepID=UPI003F9C110B
MRGMLAIQFRRQWKRILLWVVPMVAIMVSTPQAYASTYPTTESRALVVQMLRESAGPKLMYGLLPLPGGTGQMLVWECGTYLAIVGSISAALLAIATTRGEEDAGTLELVRTHGVTATTALVSGAIVVLVHNLLLALGCGIGLAAQAGSVDDVPASGAWAFAAGLFVVNSFFGALGLATGQVFPTAARARSLVMVVLGLGFLAKGIAAVQDLAWLRWPNPLAWLEIVAPYTDDRVGVAAALLPVCLAVAGVAFIVVRRRELGAGLVGDPDRSDARARISSLTGLHLLAGHGQLVGWSVAVVAAAGFFASMCGSMTDTATRDERTGDLMSQMTNGMDPVAGYFMFSGQLVGLLGLCAAVAIVLRTRRDEVTGLLDQVLATGQRRSRPLLVSTGVAMVATTLMVAVASAISVLCAELVLDDPNAWQEALRHTLGQVPAALVAAAIAAVVVAWLPRSPWLAWLPVAASGVLSMLGPVLRAPQWLVDLSLLGQSPTGWDDWPVLALMALVSALAVLAAWWRMDRRDLMA